MSINDDSREHRSQPVDFALKIVAQLFGHYLTPDDSMSLWDEQMTNAMWYADDALFCLNALSASPPDGLGARIHDATNGTFVLGNYVEPKPDGFDDRDYLAWLRDILPQLQARFDAALARQTPEKLEDEALEWTDTPDDVVQGLLADVPFWATDVTSRVEDASDEYGEGAQRFVVEYTLPYR